MDQEELLLAASEAGLLFDRLLEQIERGKSLARKTEPRRKRVRVTEEDLVCPGPYWRRDPEAKAKLIALTAPNAVGRRRDITTDTCPSPKAVPTYWGPKLNGEQRICQSCYKMYTKDKKLLQ